MVNLKIKKIERSEKNLNDVNFLIKKYKWKGSVFEYPVDFLGAVTIPRLKRINERLKRRGY